MSRPETPANVTICGWCGQPTQLVWVHGHAQCAVCHTNIEPCCQGSETCPSSGSGSRRD